MHIRELASVAHGTVAPGKGVLAADEGNPTIRERFVTISVESTEENRRRYRALLFTTGGIERSLGGVILSEETLRQSTADGRPFPDVLASCGIVPGIKVDEGTKKLALHAGEKFTEGLDGLRDWLVEYRKLGARLAK